MSSYVKRVRVLNLVCDECGKVIRSRAPGVKLAALREKAAGEGWEVNANPRLGTQHSGNRDLCGPCAHARRKEVAAAVGRFMAGD